MCIGLGSLVNARQVPGLPHAVPMWQQRSMLVAYWLIIPMPGRQDGEVSTFWILATPQLTQQMCLLDPSHSQFCLVRPY